MSMQEAIQQIYDDATSKKEMLKLARQHGPVKSLSQLISDADGKRNYLIVFENENDAVDAVDAAIVFGGIIFGVNAVMLAMS